MVLAQVRQERVQQKAAVKALMLEMLHNAVILSSWTRAAGELSPTPQFPTLGRSVFDAQLALVAQRLDFRDLVAVMQAYTSVFVLAPGMVSLTAKGILKLSAENVQHSKEAADRFLRLSTHLSNKILTRKEQKTAREFFATAQAPGARPTKQT